MQDNLLKNYCEISENYISGNMNAPGSTLDQICIAFSSSLQSRKATESVADRSRGSFLMKALLLRIYHSYLPLGQLQCRGLHGGFKTQHNSANNSLES